MRHQKLNFLWLDDGPKQELSNKMGPVATPHVFIFDKARKLRFEGRIDDAERESAATKFDTRVALDALLAGKEPPATSTRVFGCSVKWADKAGEYAKFKARWAAEPVTLLKADVATLKTLRANKDSGKIRMINVWATWCGPCIAEFNELVEHNIRFRERPFELVTIAAEFPDMENTVDSWSETRSEELHLHATRMSSRASVVKMAANCRTRILDEKGCITARGRARLSPCAGLLPAPTSHAMG